jgi:hypothetical protein
LARVSGPLPLRLPLFQRRLMPLFSTFCRWRIGIGRVQLRCPEV